MIPSDMRTWLRLWNFEGQVAGDDEPGRYVDSRPRFGVVLERRR